MLGQIISLGAIAAALYVVSIAVYRAFFSPLSRVPGPKLAAMTQGYEMYFDLLKQGRFPWKIKELHERYGESRDSPERI
jgi:hypothetical protein